MFARLVSKEASGLQESNKGLIVKKKHHGQFSPYNCFSDQAICHHHYFGYLETGTLGNLPYPLSDDMIYEWSL